MPIPIPTCDQCQRPAADTVTVELSGAPKWSKPLPPKIFVLCLRCYCKGDFHKENRHG